jgi:hypothetical protein
MAKKTSALDINGYSSTVRKVLDVSKCFSLYEAKGIQPGQGTTDYNVKTTGSMFGTVATAGGVIVKNRLGNSSWVSVKLNANTNGSITLAAGETLTLDWYDVTNLFITTSGTFGATEYVDIMLFGNA